MGNTCAEADEGSLKKYWREYTKSNNFPSDIPAGPERVYKNNGWKGMGDWLGTGTIAPKNRKFISFKEARKFVRSLDIKGQSDWVNYTKSGNKPDDIPANPWDVYKEWNIKRREKRNEKTV